MLGDRGCVRLYLDINIKAVEKKTRCEVEYKFSCFRARFNFGFEGRERSLGETGFKWGTGRPSDGESSGKVEESSVSEAVKNLGWKPLKENDLSCQ